MRLLIVHPEAGYYAGAERMLGYFLAELVKNPDLEVTAAVAPGSRVAATLPNKVEPIWLEDNQPFSPARLWRQVAVLHKFCRQHGCDLIHGWAARDWELCALVGRFSQRPTLGTLHDHPAAAFISPSRQRLMRLCARFGQKQTVCVSDAVRQACMKHGYPPGRLAVVHNGLPILASPASRPPTDGMCRLGFLGVVSERKGLRLLFQVLAILADAGETRWELHVGGAAQNAAGERLRAELQARYGGQSWWQQIRWHGWVDAPGDFLRMLDVLIVPSSEFDPLPTVLLEAAQLGLPVLATDSGGAGEIVQDSHTGWLFSADQPQKAVDLLRRCIAQPSLAARLGQQARRRLESDFPASKMVADYLKLYSTLRPNG